MSARGIVISPNFKVTPSGGIYGRGDSLIDPIDLRRYVLYWDLIDLPYNPIFEIGGYEANPDVRLLMQEGRFLRSQVYFRFKGVLNAAETLAVTQYVAMIQKGEGLWSMGQPLARISLPGFMSRNDQTIEVELARVLPVPTGDVPMEDILNFKMKRRDEFLRFRGVLDDLYLEIINSHSIPAQRNRNIDKLTQSLLDLNKVIRESRMKRVLSSLKVEIDVSDLILPFFSMTMASSLGLSPEFAVPLGIITGAIKISPKIAPTLAALPPHLKDFAYLGYIEKELLSKR